MKARVETGSSKTMCKTCSQQKILRDLWMCILLISRINSTDSFSYASILQANRNRNGSVFSLAMFSELLSLGELRFMRIQGEQALKCCDCHNVCVGGDLYRSPSPTLFVMCRYIFLQTMLLKDSFNLTLNTSFDIQMPFIVMTVTVIPMCISSQT